MSAWSDVAQLWRNGERSPVMDHSEEFVWRRDGEEAEIVVYAPNSASAERGFDRATKAATLPGTESPIFAVASGSDFGAVSASRTHLSLELSDRPGRGILISTEVGGEDLLRIFGVSEWEIEREFERLVRDSRVLVPRLNASGVREFLESGAVAAAGYGLLEEEDLTFMETDASDPEAVGRRAVSAAGRDWLERPGFPRLLLAGEVFDSDGFESLGLEPDGAVISISVPSWESGRLALGYHGERIRDRVIRGTFDAIGDPLRGLHAAPLDSEEAEDALAACGAAANFSDGLASLWLYVLRRSLGKLLGGMEIRASWRTGNIALEDGLAVHRREMVAAGSGEAYVCEGSLCSGSGEMYGSGPAFGVSERDDGRWPWEEVGIADRISRLDAPGEILR